MDYTCYYNIAEHHIKITFRDELGADNEKFIASFQPFKTRERVGDLLFHLSVESGLQPIEQHTEHIRDFDTGNGNTDVYLLEGGGYQYQIKDINGQECCLLQTNKAFTTCKCRLYGDYNTRRYGLNNAIMIAYAFSSAYQKTVMIHASLIRHDDKGYAFTAKSGTGKSTHTSLWMKHIKGADLMNDDNPVIRIIDGKTYIYGTPWSGKTPCYRNIKATLGAIVRIDRALENSVDKLKPVEAFASLLPSCSYMKWDEEISHAICNTVTEIIEKNNIFTLHCLPDQNAAEICNATITKG